MPHLTPEQKAAFKANGALIIRNALTPAQIRDARDALCEGIAADRDDPETWIDAEAPIWCLSISSHPVGAPRAILPYG